MLQIMAFKFVQRTGILARDWFSPIIKFWNSTLWNMVPGSIFRSLDSLEPFKAWFLKTYLKYDVSGVLVFKLSWLGSGENFLCALWSYPKPQHRAGHLVNLSLDTQVEWSQGVDASGTIPHHHWKTIMFCGGLPRGLLHTCRKPMDNACGAEVLQ